MKRAKKTFKNIEKIETEQYKFVCPHCHIKVIGFINEYTLMVVCPTCGNYVDFRKDMENK